MTKQKDTLGVLFTGSGMNFRSVTVRATKDEHGESLSLAADDIMIEIPMEQVKDLVQLTGDWNQR